MEGCGHTLLGPAQEVELARRWRREGDREARDELVCHNLRFALALAKRTCGRGVPVDDLAQHASRGLIDAANAYDPDAHHGIRFSTYAGWHVRNRIGKALAARGLIHVPYYLRNPATRARAKAQAQSQERSPLAACMADAERTVVVLSLDHVGPGDDGRDAFVASLVDRRTPAPGAAIEAAERAERVAAAVDRLPPLDRRIVRAVFGLDGPSRSQHAMARECGISREWARRIVLRALRRLRVELRAYGPDGPAPAPDCADEFDATPDTHAA